MMPIHSFDQAPMVVIWEITRACALACQHCRADAQTRRHPLELTFEEGCRIMDQVKELGSPIFVLTGGDPFLRKDFNELVRYGTSIGLRVSSSPSGTKLATREAMQQAADAGLRRVQFSLDGATPESHDAFRGVKGSFQWTMDGLRFAREAGMEVQIGTTVSRHSLHELKEIAKIVEENECSLWSLFFLIPVGRGQTEAMISPSEGEEVLEWLHSLIGTVPYAIKTTEAPFFRRVVAQKGGKMQMPLMAASGGAPHPAFAGKSLASPAPGLAMPGQIASFGINDGKGFVFIDHLGEVHPSGFLPVSAGNIRDQDLGTIYRESPLFRSLRDANQLKGKCGACEFRELCGGSRARAYGMTGDYLESDPSCVYIPAALRGAN
ncbi:MAG TPA: TIGR04053 family radical SAM/SPASM domain-containing protein [Symbiobacteriaceae bacterium]|nr:TIGR04053 family radical SAM/SPASM domain-containing protein [Symbiobacteriaceae bacterium]